MILCTSFFIFYNYVWLPNLRRMAYSRYILVLFLISLLSSCEKDDPIPVEPVQPEQQISKDIAVDSLQEFSQTISADADAARLGLTFSFSDFDPTGVYIPSNSTLKLTVNKLAGNGYPELLVGTYSHGTHWNKQPDVYPLKEGANTIFVNKGGMVYIRYTTELNANGKTSIKFEEGWKHSPLYKLKKTSNSTWKKMLNELNEAPTTTLIGEKSFVVVSRENAIAYQDFDQNTLLETIDEIITVENDISGMDGSEELHDPVQHKLMLVEYTGDDYYMFAYWYRTAYRKKDAVQFILNPESIRNDGWGPWHEIGHMHQMSAWTWSTVVETTVNIYSLAVEKHFGINPSRYKRDNRWEQVKTYLSLPDESRDFNGENCNIWVRLGMFYQLQLAFGDDFYKQLHKHIRKEKPAFNSDEDKMRIFMLAACRVSEKDLTTFFKNWGMKYNNSEQVYAEIAKLNLPQPEIEITDLSD